jgi:hypothetical protein
MTEASLEHNLAAARAEHVVPGREIHLQDMRGRRFCEVGLITGTSPDNAIANTWNTTGASDPTPEQVDALDCEAIAHDNQALQAWLSPVRHWMFDRLDIWEAGDDLTFGDIIGTWTGVAAAAATTQATGQRSYDPAYTSRNSAFSFTFSKGSDVYLLDAPDGEVFIMQSRAAQPNPAAAGTSLAHLGSRLDLRDGWGFRVQVLDQDVPVSSANHDNLAHLVQDDLGNIYQGSDVGRAFSQICPQDARW